MSFTIYSAPEKFGLETVGEVDWSDGCYQFDLTVVWRDQKGQLFWADSSGCSCPPPFEDTGLPDLKACTSAELQAHLDKRLDGKFGTAETCDEWDLDERNKRAGRIVDLVGRVIAW
ncbi:DUF7574 domain-containing protein [Streptosporangium sp. H16]|uniref:DUF7574 domain-containing protein n=1 Tax=Streptosporangium sp. H16 TaxID=3444184 RepID=UPI003F7AFCF5